MRSRSENRSRDTKVISITYRWIASQSAISIVRIDLWRKTSRVLVQLSVGGRRIISPWKHKVSTLMTHQFQNSLPLTLSLVAQVEKSPEHVISPLSSPPLIPKLEKNLKLTESTNHSTNSPSTTHTPPHRSCHSRRSKARPPAPS